MNMTDEEIISFCILAFAKFVGEIERIKEREACAKLCEQIDIAAFGSERPAPNDCAAAIRARGEA